MILGLGIDIIETSRIERAMRNPRFLHRLFSPAERRQLGQQLTDPQTVAGRFAAKEAICKALGTGIGRVSWQELEIYNMEQGVPVVQLRGAAREIFDQRGGVQMLVSITHVKELAAATAILEGA